MFPDECNPPGEQRWDPSPSPSGPSSPAGLPQHQLPKRAGHLRRENLLSWLKAEREGEAVEVLEEVRRCQALCGGLGQARLEGARRVGAEGAAAAMELGAGQAAHLSSAALPSEHQDPGEVTQ